MSVSIPSGGLPEMQPHPGRGEDTAGQVERANSLASRINVDFSQYRTPQDGRPGEFLPLLTGKGGIINASA